MFLAPQGSIDSWWGRTPSMDYEALAQQHGTPLFIYHPARLEANYRKLTAALARHFPRWLLAYSMKANSYPPLLQRLASLGAGFDCLSLQDLQTGLRLNTAANRMILTGPCKRDEELKLALTHGMKVNCDSIEQVERAAALAKGGRVGMRVALGKPSKIGIEPTHMLSAFRRARELGLEPIGVSGHPGTQVRELTWYDGFLRKFTRTLNELEHAGLDPEYIDLGGGFPDPFEMRERHLTVDHFFQAAKRALFPHVDFDLTTLMFGAGRVLVADCFEVLTRVHYVKHSFGRKYVLLDVGTNYLNPAGLARPRFRNTTRPDPAGEKNHYTLAGPLPFAADTFGGFEGDLRAGDLMLVENAGAYTLEMAWRMSYGAPKVIEAPG